MLRFLARKWQDKFGWNREKEFDRALVQLFPSMIRPQYCTYRWTVFSEDDARPIAGGANRVWVYQLVEDNAFHRVTAMQSKASAAELHADPQTKAAVTLTAASKLYKQQRRSMTTCM